MCKKEPMASGRISHIGGQWVRVLCGRKGGSSQSGAVVVVNAAIMAGSRGVYSAEEAVGGIHEIQSAEKRAALGPVALWPDPLIYFTPFTCFVIGCC